ncbi:hypothetical protein SGPA1_12708 [Streptomyces misionensis JCM 4497]
MPSDWVTTITRDESGIFHAYRLPDTHPQGNARPRRGCGRRRHAHRLRKPQVLGRR